MRLHAQLTLDYGRQKPLEAFETFLAIFQRQGFVREQFCTLRNWRSLEKARHFHIRGSLFSDISFVPIQSHRVDLFCRYSVTWLAAIDRVLTVLLPLCGA